MKEDSCGLELAVKIAGEELANYASTVDGILEVVNDQLRLAQRQIAQVKRLHWQYRDAWATPESGDSCAHCNGFTDAGRVPWPCPTIRALRGEEEQ